MAKVAPESVIRGKDMANKIFELRERVAALEEELACMIEARTLFRNERDEAREAACLAFDHLRERFWHTSVTEWERKYPFLTRSPRSDLRGLR
jgi:hypothetical protein